MDILQYTGILLGQERGGLGVSGVGWESIKSLQNTDLNSAIPIPKPQ